MNITIDRNPGPHILSCGNRAAIGMRVRHWMIPTVRGRILALGAGGEAVCVRVEGEESPRWTHSGVWERDPATIKAFRTEHEHP